MTSDKSSSSSPSSSSPELEAIDAYLAEFKTPPPQGPNDNSHTRNDGPGTVTNPRNQPPRPGEWRYVTAGDNSAQHQARVNFGGQVEYGFIHVARPSAAQMFALRRQMQVKGDHDNTQEIRLVWVPSGGANQPVVNDEYEENSCLDDNEHGNASKHDADDMDTANGGTVDQTGDGDAEYDAHTTLDGRTIVIDRSVANTGVVQPHKLTFYSIKHNDWKHRDTSNGKKMDRSDRKMIDALNRWRTQGLARNHWAPKRQTFEDYTDEQRKWIALHAKYNETFGQKRTKSAITSYFYRLRKEGKTSNGKFELLLGRKEAGKRPKTQKSAKSSESRAEGKDGGLEEQESDTLNDSAAPKKKYHKPSEKDSDSGGKKGGKK